MPEDDYLSVTELAGEDVSVEQLRRMVDRYSWALPYCRHKDVVEVACGTGQGLGLLAREARSLVGGDVSRPMVERGRAHYGDRVDIDCFDATRMPFPDSSKDVVIIFEALYYVPSPSDFLAECRRVLRPSGRVLIATANKDVPGFNPSPFSHQYHGAPELTELLADHGFAAECLGNTPVTAVSGRQRALQPAKRLAVRLHLMPKTMAGKKLLKRLVFGRLVKMPSEIPAEAVGPVQTTKLDAMVPDRTHKVLLCSGTLPDSR